MNIVYLPTNELIPYSRNAKKHPAQQVGLIANSIREFGFQQPIVVDKNNIVVIGHGRLLAAKRLHMKEVPVVRADDLTDDQIKALRLADNKVAESDWKMDLVASEIADIQLDMTDFGFLDSLEEESDSEEEGEDVLFEDEALPRLQHNVFENQERHQFPADNFYGIPSMRPTQTVGSQMLRFMDWAEVEDLSEYIAHFYYDDYKFMAAWRDPDKYIERLKKFKAVVSPDFSLYTDFPRCLQILSCYRRQWCGRYWQEHGIDVIPDVIWGDKESFDYCFLGIPKHSVVAVSSVGVALDGAWNNKESDMFKAGYDEMLKRLEPTAILWYGDLIDGCEGNIIHCPSFYAERRKALNEQAKARKKKRPEDE